MLSYAFHSLRTLQTFEQKHSSAFAVDKMLTRKAAWCLQGIIPLLAALLQLPGEHQPQVMRMLRRLSAYPDHAAALAQVQSNVKASMSQHVR